MAIPHHRTSSPEDVTKRKSRTFFTVRRISKKKKADAAVALAQSLEAAANTQIDDDYCEYRGEKADRRFWASAFAGSKEQSKLIIGRVSVKVIEAAHLPAADLGGTSDPYCVIMLTGCTTNGQPWQENERWMQKERTKTIKKELNPQFLHETTLSVYRHDMMLRIEVYDEDQQSTDDLLGVIQLPLSEMAEVGALNRWWKLDVQTGFTAPDAALHLIVNYDVSALGEAMSMLWTEPPRTALKYVFDVNMLYENGLNLKKELNPYITLAEAAQGILTWTDIEVSQTWFAFFLLCAYFVHYALILFHVAIATLLLHSRYKVYKREKIKSQAAAIFAKLDSDHSNSLDRQEIRQAVRQLGAQVLSSQKAVPTDEQIDADFSQYDTDSTNELNLDQFTNMLMHSNAIMGVHALHENCNEQALDTNCPITQFDTSSYDTKESSRTERIPTPRKKRLFSFSATSSGLTNKKTISFSSDDPGNITDTSEDVEGKASSPHGGAPFRGMAKKMINIVGRKAGSAVAKNVHRIGTTATAIAKLRDLYEWTSPKNSIACVALNLLGASIHCFLPLRVFAILLVLAAFFVCSQKHIALRRIIAKGPSALKRYRELSSHHHQNSSSLTLGSKSRPVMRNVASGALFSADAFNSKALSAIIRAIFSRLDVDGSGQIDASELCHHVMRALPDATPRSRALVGGDEATVKRRIHRLVKQYDINNDGGIDRDEFQQIVSKTGTIQVLIQEELRLRLSSEAGLKCSKLPSKKWFGSSSFSAHQTSITLTNTPTHYNLGYTSRRGDKCFISQRCLLTIEPIANQKGALIIRYLDNTKYKEKRALYLSVSEALRDPLYGLLTHLLFTKKTQQKAPPHLPSSSSSLQAAKEKVPSSSIIPIASA